MGPFSHDSKSVHYLSPRSNWQIIMIKWAERNSQVCYLLLGLLCTFPLIFLTPPFQVPDEPQHFYRAYQISEMNFVASVENQKAGGELPSSLITLSSTFLNTRAIHDARPVVKRPFSSILDGFSTRLEPAKREFIDFSGSAFYSPIAYLPQSIGIAVGRGFELGPMALMYLGRAANAAIAIFLLSFAAKVAPGPKMALLVVGLFPMSVYLYGSLSPDALVIVSAFLFTAISLRAYVERKWRIADILIATSCALVFSSLKVVYAPLLFIGFASVFTGERRAKFLLPQIAIVVIPMLVTGIWLNTVSSLVLPVKTGIDISAQIRYVATHPLLFIRAVAHAFLNNDFYFFNTVGVLGWLTVKLPAISYVVAVVAFVGSLCSSEAMKPRRSVPVLMWWGALAGSCVGLVMLALYLYWNVVGAWAVEGVQGRYLIPIIPLFTIVIAELIFPKKWRISSVNAPVWIGTLILLEAILTFFTLIRSFWSY